MTTAEKIEAIILARTSSDLGQFVDSGNALLAIVDGRTYRVTKAWRGGWEVLDVEADMAGCADDLLAAVRYCVEG